MSLRYAVLMVLGLVVSGCMAEKEVTLRVPSMSCKACFRAAEDTLKNQEGVGSVTLYPQANPNEIDDPRVLITVTGRFDAEKAIAALAAEEFGGVTVEDATDGAK
jgi:copper chaperone CopZ